jgi:hypothetical protein
VSEAGHVVEFVAGAVLVLAAVLSAVRSTILPRGSQSRISSISLRGVRWAFRLRAGRSSTYEGRDRILAMLGPIALLVLLATWLVLILVGYTLMYLAVTGRSLSGAIELSGSSLFTLGTTSETRLGPQLLTYSEAGLGLLILALLITYLPSIYGAFSRRENGVSLLLVRAGVPPRPATMLIRFQRIEESRFRLTELWKQWEAWFADVEETHTTFPILVLFRSPQPDRSWVTTAGALLDAASFWAGTIEHPKDPDVQLCIRAGFLALRRVADSFRVPYDADPAPDDPISVERGEWDEAMSELEEAGMPVMADRDQAWAAWKGWRVNYDTVLLNLARLVDAPPAPWLSDRSPVGPDLRWSLRSRVSGVGGGLRRRMRTKSGQDGETPAS